MSRNNGKISPERKELLDKADTYLEEFEIASEDLEVSSKKFGKNLLMIASIGLGLAYSFKLISGSEEKTKSSDIETEIKPQKKRSRVGSALKAIAIPFIIGIAKNVVLPDLNKTKKNGDGGNP